MACAPAASIEKLRAAVPFVSATTPNVAVPSLKFTLPVGVPPACDVTVVVKVTDSLKLDGLTEDIIAVVVTIFRGLMLRRITPPTAKSGLPSRLKSPTAIPGLAPPRVRDGWNVPLPLP